MKKNRRSWTRSNPLINAPLPPLPAYRRCTCGTCSECRTNARWDNIFAKFEAKDDKWPTKGMFQSTLRGW